jgi:phage/plasmid primase-like uncharacterized protein
MNTIAALLSHFDRPKKSGSGYVAYARCHNDRHHSLSIGFSERWALLHCFTGCPFDEVLVAHGLTRRDLYLGEAPAAPSREERIKYARSLWEQSRSARGTMVESYLQSRGITLPIPPAIRFIPTLKHREYGWSFPAMIAGVQDVNGKFCAAQITFLCADARLGKAPVHPQRKDHGPIAGGAVRLTSNPGDAVATVVVAEGVETALSIAQACPELPVWAALGTSNLTRIELPTTVREVIVAADADNAGKLAAREAADRFKRAGRTVLITKPLGATDFNEITL